MRSRRKNGHFKYQMYRYPLLFIAQSHLLVAATSPQSPSALQEIHYNRYSGNPQVTYGYIYIELIILSLPY
jgi:hypothetical protein